MANGRLIERYRDPETSASFRCDLRGSLGFSSLPPHKLRSTGDAHPLWVDVGRCAAGSGIRKLIFLNSHGGQTQLVDIAALRLRAELGMLTVRADYFRLGSPDGLFDAKELAHGIHGGEVETSLRLHLRPDLVRLEALHDFDGLPARLARENAVLGVEEPIGIGWMSQDPNPAGVVGNAAGADAARGSRLLSHLAERLVTLLRETAGTPLSTLRNGPLQR